MSDRSVVASSVFVALAASVAAGSLAGCEGCSDGTRQPTAATAPSASDAGRTVSLHRAVPRDAAADTKPGCKLFTGGETARWMSTPGATVRVLESGREWRLQGDDLLPCANVGNIEVTLLSQGNAENLAGGEGAGAEAWLASPCAAVRAMGAAHKITAKDDTCILHVSGGTLLVWIAADVHLEAEGGAPPDAGAAGVWHRLDPRTDLTWRFDPKKPTPAVEACEAAAAGMDSVMAAMSKGALGQAAAEAAHIRANVRASCAIARTRVRRAAPDAGESPLDKRIDAAVARGLGDAWRTQPSDAGPPP